MDENKILEYLDWMLSYFRGEKPNILFNIDNVGFAIIEKETGKALHKQRIMQELKLKEEHYCELIDILISDNCIAIYPDSTNRRYSMDIKKSGDYTIKITLSGIAFEGFLNRKKRINGEKNRIYYLENRGFYVSVILAVGTTVAGLYYLIEILKDFCWCY